MAGSFSPGRSMTKFTTSLEERLALVGLRKLKNVTLPIEIYKVVMPWEKVPPKPELSTERLVVTPLCQHKPRP